MQCFEIKRSDNLDAERRISMVLAGLGISLMLIVLITSKWQNVPAAMVIGSTVLALSMSMDINATCNIISKVVYSYNTVELVAAVLLITLLSTVMYQTLLLEDLLDSLTRLIKRIHLLLIIILPVMGLLAIPGGAIMSAPFADKIGDRINMDPGSKSAINIFFRHTSAFVNPMAPTLIMVANFTKIGLSPIIKFFMLPIFISILLGLLILIKVWPVSDNGVGEPETTGQSVQSGTKALKQFLISGSPIILALGLAGTGINYILVLIMALFLSFYLDRKTHCILGRSDIKNLLVHGTNWRLGLAVFTILLFGAFVQNNEAIPLLAEIIHKINMPFIVILLTTSMVIGFVAGHPIVGSAIVYPIFMPLVGHDIAGITYLSLIFFGIMFGYIVSPIHLCLIVSNEFFGVGYKEVYPPLLLLQLILLVSVLATALILIWI